MDQAASVAIPPQQAEEASAVHHKLNKSPGKLGIAIFALALLAGAIYTIFELSHDLSGTHMASLWPYVLLTVQDTGTGIDDAVRAHLFEPFSQEQTGYARAFEGNGLGLPKNL